MVIYSYRGGDNCCVFRDKSRNGFSKVELCKNGFINDGSMGYSFHQKDRGKEG